MPKTWTAHYLDGRSAARHRVTIQVTPDTLQILTPSGETRHWPYGQIRQTQGTYAGEPVRLEFGAEPSETIVISSTALLTELHRVAPAFARRFHNPVWRDARVRWTMLAAVAVVALTAGIYRWGIPGFASAATPYVPVSWEDTLGKQVVEHLAPEDRQCKDPARTEKLSRIVQSLTATVPSSLYQIRLYVLDSPQVNAFAAPGGHVLLLRGLLEHTETPEQLAGVLAHELQHIYKRHATRAILEQTASTFLLTAVSGDFSGGLAWGLEGARTMGSLHYSRAHETEADIEGLKMMQTARLDPTAMIAFYGIMQKETKDHAGPLDFLATHPNMGERLATLLTLAGPRPPQATSLLPNDEWKDIRSLCRLRQKTKDGGASSL